MPLPEDQKNSTPFKSVDIKTLFLSASNRKRKASSPIPTLCEAKNVKICNKESEDEIQILNVSDAAEISTSDSKENKDLNTVSNEPVHIVNSSNENEDPQKGSNNHSCEEESLKDSSDELNSSNLNSSVNALNSSGISEVNQDAMEVNASINSESIKTESKIVNIKDKGSNSKKRKKMTPEEAKQRAEEREKKQQERLLKKQELEAKKQEREHELLQRKLQKELEKKAKEEEKIEKEKQRLEKKEQEEKEKQMKAEERESQKRIRQMQLEQKLEMKKHKEEMKQKQDEERKKAEEDKKMAELEKEQKEKEKKERAKAAFKKFFVKENASPPPPIQKPVEQGVFKPFQISDDMTLAPVVPSVAQERFNREILDSALKLQMDKILYLQILKSGSYSDVRRRKKMMKPKFCDADVIVIDKSTQTGLYLKAKLLQFCENVRPPYWGTWRRKSKTIRPRNPFVEDKTIFDYEVDSDDEWDEGGPGESLSGTEQEDESEDDYEVDNEFFVPHGYLSAEEEKEEEEEEKDTVNDPEKQKALLKKKLQEFEMERKKKTTELKPIIVGCYIENGSQQNIELRALLESYSAVMLTENPIPTTFTVKLLNDSKPNSTTSSPSASMNSANKSKKVGVPEEAMSHLIRLLHGNTHNLPFLISEFQKFWQQHCLTNDQPNEALPVKEETVLAGSSSSVVPESPMTTVDSMISKRQLTLISRQIATKRSIESIKKPVWWVNEDVLEKYGLKDAPIPNTWTYVTSTSKEELELTPVAKPVSVSIKDFLSP